MILIMMFDEVNTKAAEALSKLNGQKIDYLDGSSEFDKESEALDLANSEDTALTLVDLRADGWFQSGYSPNPFAKFLQERGLIQSSIERIYLLVSDVDMEHPLISFASGLVKEISKLGKDITVSVCSNVNTDVSVITFPKSEDDKWKVYQIRDINIQLDTPYHEKIKLLEAKNSTWQGGNIYEWLDKPRQIFSKKDTYIPSASESKSETSSLVSSFSSPVFSKEKKEHSSHKRKLEDIIKITDLEESLEDPEFPNFLVQLPATSIEKLGKYVEKVKAMQEQTQSKTLTVKNAQIQIQVS